MTDERQEADVLEKIRCESASARLLADCWFSTLGYYPSDTNDTLNRHGVSTKQKKKLLQAICAAYNCELHIGLFPSDVPFSKTAELLATLAPGDKGSGPLICLAPGLAGVGLGELLLASAYRGPGRIHLFRYPTLDRICEKGDAIEAHIDAVLRQLDQLGSTALSATAPGLILAGYSLGAHVIFEAACRLEKRGTPVARLVLINSVAFPQRRDLRGFDFKLTECRQPHDLIRWMEWKLARENKTALRLGWRTLSFLRKIGFVGKTREYDSELSCTIRLKAFSYTIRHSQYSGEIALLRPSGNGSHSEDDAGWSAFGNKIQIVRLPATHKNFLNSENRRLAADELSQIVLQSMESDRDQVQLPKSRSAQAPG
jgi:thioesterase domain-containing protein